MNKYFLVKLKIAIYPKLQRLKIKSIRSFFILLQQKYYENVLIPLHKNSVKHVVCFFAILILLVFKYLFIHMYVYYCVKDMINKSLT